MRVIIIAKQHQINLIETTFTISDCMLKINKMLVGGFALLIC